MTEDIYTIDPVRTVQPPETREKKTEAPVLKEESPVSQSITEVPAVYEYLGENNKYSLIIINDPSHPSMPPKELEALQNILKAKKQELKDVAILNLHKYPSATFKSLKDFFACNSLILFGINPSQIQLEQVQANQITAIQNTRILATYSFSEMLGSVDKKRMFWEEMKKL
jgi:hypothetical protein